MKTKIIVILSFFLTTLFTSCQREDVDYGSMPTVSQPMQTGFCCGHLHARTVYSDEGVSEVRYFYCCSCKATCGGGAAISLDGDTLYVDDMLSGVYVEYLQDNSVMYSFTTDESGHWDSLNEVAHGTYDIRFSKTCYITKLIKDIEVSDTGYHKVIAQMEADPLCETSEGD